MRFPRVRLTVRRMMVAVAGVATVLWVVERRERFKRTALGHSTEVNRVFTDLELVLVATVAQHESDEHAAERQRLTYPLVRFRRYHYRMVDKYERAASRPWLPVASDPPPPPKPSRDDFKAVFLRLEGCPYDLNSLEPQ
jgi:hypothetical protein